MGSLVRISGALALGALVAGCSEPAGWQTCEVDYRQSEYVFDGARGFTGCIPSRMYVLEAWGTIGPSRPELKIDIVYRDTPEQRPATDHRQAGFPLGVCGAGLFFDNVPLETGASGTVRDPRSPQSGWDRRVYTALAFDPTPEHDPCLGEPPEFDTVRPAVTDGTWEVVRGGGRPGDVVEIEARDITFEPFLGHEFRYERMYFWLVYPEPVMLP